MVLVKKEVFSMQREKEKTYVEFNFIITPVYFISET